MTDPSHRDPKLQVASLKEMQPATLGALNATSPATDAQPQSLKALAIRVLERNRGRNRKATIENRPCNLDPEKSQETLHEIALSLRPDAPSGTDLTEAAAGQPMDLDALAQEIAAETGLPVAKVLGLLDADDREAIRTGSDSGRAAAWRCAAKALEAPSDLVHAPAGTGWPRAVVVWTPIGRPVLAWAESLEHAELLKRWNPAPGETGPEVP